jgi:hypothetical protein
MFPGSKGGRCVELTTFHLHVQIVLKSGNLNHLEPSGPVKACNWIALPFTITHSALNNLPQTIATLFFRTDISGQLIGPISKGQSVQEEEEEDCLVLEYGTTVYPEMSVRN